MSADRRFRFTPKPPEIVVETADNARDFSVLLVKKAHAGIASFGGERDVTLDLELEDAGGELRRYLLPLADVDPYLLAADLQACADDVLRRAAIDAGLDTIAAESAVREARRAGRIARRQLTEGFQGASESTCSYCLRSTAFIVDGVRYCKRHAEEYGVRPHGKIGEAT